ncbi:hypothetical protein B0H13DRAFT_1861389 [Mycena leptocephala]|nr:hypothetical protein B0H13DRAFT_1861389 [Mycena leptocephala]
MDSPGLPISSALPFSPGDIVLAKFEDFPPWPAIILGPANLPRDLTASKGVGHPLGFFGDDTYAWVPSQDLTHLTMAAIEVNLAGAKQPLLKEYVEVLVPGYTDARNALSARLETDTLLKAMEKNKEERKQIIENLTTNMSQTGISRFGELLGEANEIVRKLQSHGIQWELATKKISKAE